LHERAFHTAHTVSHSGPGDGATAPRRHPKWTGNVSVKRKGGANARAGAWARCHPPFPLCALRPRLNPLSSRLVAIWSSNDHGRIDLEHRLPGLETAHTRPSGSRRENLNGAADFIARGDAPSEPRDRPMSRATFAVIRSRSSRDNGRAALSRASEPYACASSRAMNSCQSSSSSRWSSARSAASSSCWRTSGRCR